MHGKDRTPQFCTQSTAQAVVWRVGVQKVWERRERDGNECAAQWVVAAGQGGELPGVPVLRPSVQEEGCDCGGCAAEMNGVARHGCWHGNGRGSRGEHAVSDCPCEVLNDVWTCVVHGWGVAPWTAMGKPDLTSGGLGLAVKGGGVPCARPAHAAVNRWVGRWTAMQKPDLTSCGHGHDANGNDLEEWRCVRGACGWQACGGACAGEQEKSACATSSPYDVVCDAAPWLTWRRR